MIVLLDNTVLSNFALVDRIELIRHVLGTEAASTPQVIAEFDAGVSLGRLPETDLDWLPILTLSSEEEASYERFMRHLNRGEASCLAIAHHRPASVPTDDRDARVFAGRMGIAVSGTVGVLVRSVKTRDVESSPG
ncbi:MAG: DUF3368 domain-containing protein [bacterium]|nr:DUF3368 domain-containing protein [bacterium]